MARPRNTSLATRVAASAPVAAPAADPAFQARDGVDRDDLHIAIADRLDMGSRLTPALLEITRADGLSGAARIDPLRRAIKLLAAEARRIDPQFVVTALAMCVVLPAWPIVMLKCGGVL